MLLTECCRLRRLACLDPCSGWGPAAAQQPAMCACAHAAAARPRASRADARPPAGTRRLVRSHVGWSRRAQFCSILDQQEADLRFNPVYNMKAGPAPADRRCFRISPRLRVALCRRAAPPLAHPSTCCACHPALRCQAAAARSRTWPGMAKDAPVCQTALPEPKPCSALDPCSAPDPRAPTRRMRRAVAARAAVGGRGIGLYRGVERRHARHADAGHDEGPAGLQPARAGGGRLGGLAQLPGHARSAFRRAADGAPPNLKPAPNLSGSRQGLTGMVG